MARPQRYKKQLGDFLRTRRAEIAEKAGITPEEAGNQLATDAGMTPDALAELESDSRAPTDDECRGLAEALGKHGESVTAEQIADMAKDDEAEDDTKSEGDGEKTDQADRAAEETVETLRANLAAAQGAHVELEPLRKQVSELTARVAELEPLAAAGRTVLDRKRAALTKLFVARAGGADKVEPVLTARLTKADLAGLEELRAVAGFDPLTDELCSDCGQKHSAAYQSSRVAMTTTADGAAPARTPHAVGTPRPAGQRPTDFDQLDAAKAFALRAKSRGDEMSEQDALRAVRVMSDAQIFQLVDEAAAAGA